MTRPKAPTGESRPATTRELHDVRAIAQHDPAAAARWYRMNRDRVIGRMRADARRPLKTQFASTALDLVRVMDRDRRILAQAKALRDRINDRRRQLMRDQPASAKSGAS